MDATARVTSLVAKVSVKAVHQHIQSQLRHAFSSARTTHFKRTTVVLRALANAFCERDADRLGKSMPEQVIIKLNNKQCRSVKLVVK